jgi:23S rRNA (cytidine1920-2'-O)/16S rRNA (cytidine1409-2'-O)-methyltransferase
VQFEAERQDVADGGVVLDAAVHKQVCQRAEQWLNAQPGWSCLGTTESAIRGLTSGNIEFFIWGAKE